MISPIGLATIATKYSAGFSESAEVDDSRTRLDLVAACASKNSPQCRHLTAEANTCSPQYGQSFIAGPEATGALPFSCNEYSSLSAAVRAAADAAEPGTV